MMIGYVPGLGMSSTGDFAEVLVYDKVLSAAQRQQVESYLSQKWFAAPSAPSAPVIQTDHFSEVPAIRINDPDGTATSRLQVTLGVEHGILTLGNSSGLSFQSGDGTGDTTMTFTGTQSDINAALETLCYTWAGSRTDASTLGDTLHITTTDQGSALTGSPRTSTASVAINVDIPQSYSGLLATYYSNADFTGSTYQRVDSSIDFDWGNHPAAAGLGTDSWSARWEGSIVADSTGTYTFYATHDDGMRVWVNGTQVIDAWDYSPNASTGTINLTAGQAYSIRVDYYEGWGGNAAKLEWSGPGVSRQVISADNLYCVNVIPHTDAAPVNNVPTTQTLNVNTPLTFSAANGNAITISDVDAYSEKLQVTLAMSSGTFSLGRTTGLTFSSGDGASDTTMTFTGSLSNINAALDGMKYMPVANATGPVTLQITTNDQAPTLAGGPKIDSDTLTINITAPSNTQGLLATFYSNMDFTGTTIQRIDSTINFDWGFEGSPAPGIAGSHYSAVWAGQIQATASGAHTFFATVDDGCRLWVNNQLVIDRIGWTGTTACQGSINLTEGQWYSIRMEYAQDTNGNCARLEWSTPNQARQLIPTAQLRCENVAPTSVVPGAQSTNEETSLVFSVAGGNAVRIEDADASGPLEVTLAASTGTLTLSRTNGLTFSSGDGSGDGTMTFTGTLSNINAALDGLRYTPGSNYTGDYSPTATIEIATNDHAPAMVGGEKTSTATIPVAIAASSEYHGMLATYYNNIDFTGTAVQRVDQSINFDWNGAAPIAGIDGSSWSARWEGNLTANATETYTFHATVDDGVRLWVNNVLLIDSWQYQAATTYSGSINLVAGQQYAVRMEYFQGGGGSSAKLEWSSASNLREVIPSSQLETTPRTPVNMVPGAQGGSLNQAVVFSTDLGSAIAVQELGIGNNPLSVTLAATSGTISLSGLDGLTFSEGDGAGDATMTFSGTVENINRALNGLSYVRADSSAAVLTITTTDASAPRRTAEHDRHGQHRAGPVQRCGTVGNLLQQRRLHGHERPARRHDDQPQLGARGLARFRNRRILVVRSLGRKIVGQYHGELHVLPLGRR